MEYPKWVGGWIVPDAETEQAVLAGHMNHPVLPQSAQANDVKPVMPSVNSPEGQALLIEFPSVSMGVVSKKKKAHS